MKKLKKKKKLSNLKIDQSNTSNSSKIILSISQQFSNLDSTPSPDSIDSCYDKTKICNVLTKFEEQENLIITLISKLENPELKEEYLKKLKKIMIKDINKPSQSKLSLDETLKKFSKQKSKVVTISDLQHEIDNIKKDIFDLKKDCVI